MVGRRPCTHVLQSLDRVHRIARRTGAQFVSAEQLQQWLGGGPLHAALDEFPTAALLAPPGTIILPQHLPNSNIGHHGGITPQEQLIPLLGPVHAIEDRCHLVLV